MYDRVGNSNGFSVYKVRHAAGYPDGGLPEIVGYQSSNPELTFRCPPGVIRCAITAPYRASDVTFSIERATLAKAPEIMAGIRDMLDHHNEGRSNRTR